MALHSDLPSSLFRVCAMCDLGACPSPALLPAGHPATRNIPTTPAAAGMFALRRFRLGAHFDLRHWPLTGFRAMYASFFHGGSGRCCLQLSLRNVVNTVTRLYRPMPPALVLQRMRLRVCGPRLHS